jgi:hypothetical protein
MIRGILLPHTLFARLFAAMILHTRALPRPATLALIAAISLLAIIITRPGEPATRLISRWQPREIVTRPDVHAGREPAPPPLALTGRVAAVDAFNLSVDDGLYPGQREQLAADVNAAYGYVVARFGSGARGRFTAAFQAESGCGLHGIADTEARNVRVFTCSAIDRQRAINIMAHEIVHQLAQDRYGPAHLNADLILLEGVATWGAGKYWLGDQPDFRGYVKAQRASGLSYPLATDYTGLGVTAMNALYYQWASFVEYLIKTYGREQFDRLYVSGNGAPGSADYAGVYGKGLDVLEREWSAWVDR